MREMVSGDRCGAPVHFLYNTILDRSFFGRSNTRPIHGLVRLRLGCVRNSFSGRPNLER
jgi:hypothetical protein